MVPPRQQRGSSVLLHLQTWEEVEAYLRNAKGIIVPIGSTEQHGPNGLIGTDAICAEAIAAEVGEAAGALVGPTINVGNAQHHLAFAGTITLRPSTLIAVIGDYVASLARHGFERFYFINGHGGNIATIGAAFAEIYAGASLRPGNGPPLRCALKNWWETSGVSKLSKELYGDREGSHATPSEVSVTQHVYPEAIKRRGMGPPAPRVRGFTDAEDYRRLFPDGRIGSDPTLASPEHGARFVAAAVRDIGEEYRRFVTQD
jgi:creatinine amidohydrolase